MAIFGVLGMFILTLMVVGLGLVALLRLAGWWSLLLASAILVIGSLVALVQSPEHAMALPGLLDALVVLGAVVAGERAWRGVVTRGSAVSPLALETRLRTKLLAVGGGLVVGLTLVHAVFGGAWLAGATQGLLAVGILALGLRLRGGFLLVLVSQVLVVLQVVAAVAAVHGSYTLTGLVGWLMAPLLQAVALSAVSWWGWTEWATRERTRPASSRAHAVTTQ